MRAFSGVYRGLLLLMPGHLRRRHGREMVKLFELMLESARARGRVRLMAEAMLAYADVVRRIPHEHARRLHPRYAEGTSMNLSFRFELRQAMRSLKRQPATSMLVIAMLALGVAANTTVFTMINALFLRPLPWSESERLVYLNERAPSWNLEYTGINYPDFLAWRTGARVFDGMALYDARSFNLVEGANTERVDGVAITYDFLDVMRIKPVLGRGFTAEEDRPNAPAVALISHDMWQTRFGGSQDVLGRSIRLDSRPATIVGVMPPNAEFPRRGDIWVPLAEDPSVTWQSYQYDGVARLEPGVTLEAASADLLRAHQPIFDARDSVKTVSPRVDFMRDRLVGEFRMLAVALAGGVAIILLIACANVSSVMLARATGRQREFGIRRALGAGSGRIARQMFAENLVLATLGTAFGVLWGYWAVRALIRSLPEETPPWLQFDLDYRVLAFAATIALGTALISGLAPMLQSARASLQSALSFAAGTRTSVGRAHRRTLNGLVVAEIALAVVLLVGGGLFLRAYERVQNVEPGFRPHNVLTARVSLPWTRYSDPAPTKQFYLDLAERVRALPGVEYAAAISRAPLRGHQGQFATVEGEPERTEEQGNPVTLYRWASHDYDRAMGLVLKAGRFLEERDDLADTARVIVVNETFVKTFIASGDAVGRRVRFNDSGPPLTVVGVVGDVKHYGLSEPMRPGVYVPLSAVHGAIGLSLAVRTTGDPYTVLPSIRAAVRELDPELPLFDVKTMDEVLAESLAFRRMYSWLLAVFAGVALTLAVGGIYGVLSYVVGQRRKEIGIRVALGAQRSSVMRLVMKHGLGVAAVGALIGVLGALPVSTLFKSILYGAEGQDPITYAAVLAILGGTCVLASYIPARRALRFEPQAVLRDG